MLQADRFRWGCSLRSQKQLERRSVKATSRHALCNTCQAIVGKPKFVKVCKLPNASRNSSCSFTTTKTNALKRLFSRPISASSALSTLSHTRQFVVMEVQPFDFFELSDGRRKTAYLPQEARSTKISVCEPSNQSHGDIKSPVSWLLEKFSRCRLESRPMVSGMLPVSTKLWR